MELPREAYLSQHKTLAENMLETPVCSDTIKVNSTYLHMVVKIVLGVTLELLKSDLCPPFLTGSLHSEVELQHRVIPGAYSSAACPSLTAKLGAQRLITGRDS